MGIGEVIVPFAPSGFSAWGMLSADIVNDFSRTVMATLDDADLAELEQLFKAVEAEAVASLVAQGVPAGEAVLERQFDLRYLGQEHSLMVTVGREPDRDAVRAAFDETHRARYGHAMGNPLQILNLRVRGIGRTDRPELADPAARRRRPVAGAAGAPRRLRLRAARGGAVRGLRPGRAWSRATPSTARR